MAEWTAYCDGASRGNPGPAAYGAVLCDPSGAVVMELGEAIGVNTNQVAEYEALIRVLAELRTFKASRVKVFTDSQFVARQFSGQYRAKDARMKALLARVRELQAGLGRVEVVHIARSSHPHNRRADALANEALDRARARANRPSPAPSGRPPL
jgi:ribonuclease HI